MSDIIEEYTEVTNQTAIYPGAGLGTIETLCYVGLGLGECGEVQGKLKKVLRDDNGILTSEKAEAILDELGDVVWYTVRMCEEIGVGLEYVMRRNMDKLLGRKERGVIGGSGDNR